MKLIFDWDERKEKTNIKKHGINFEEGKTIFNDPFLFTAPDTKHSEDEDRFINIGLSTKNRILVLIHTGRQDTIRIISCRKAKPKERRFYEEARS